MAEYIIKINDNDETDSDGGKRVEEMHRLVRCKDCKLRGTYDCHITYLTGQISDSGDWFCADGERKDDEYN